MMADVLLQPRYIYAVAMYACCSCIGKNYVRPSWENFYDDKGTLIKAIICKSS